jgi:hypothetical protein
MAIRTFIFCDICNAQALRSIEFRRTTRDDTRSGRRISDGRAWLELSDHLSLDDTEETNDAKKYFEFIVEQTILKAGWVRTTDNLYLCPLCQAAHSSEST